MFFTVKIALVKVQSICWPFLMILTAYNCLLTCDLTVTKRRRCNSYFHPPLSEIALERPNRGSDFLKTGISVKKWSL